MGSSTRLLVSLLLGFTGIPSAFAADQQGQVDDGVSFGQSLLGNVKDLSKNAESSEVPGYGGSTSLPLTDYYAGQDISTMQENAIVDLSSGTANEAAQYGYDQASVPKLQFSPDDPIVLNSETMGNEAVLNPGVITVPTGDCEVVDTSQAETRIEHCTAWDRPSDHNCSNRLDVEVTWSEEANCPLGSPYSEASTAHSSPLGSGNVFAQGFCAPGSTGDKVNIQTHVYNAATQHQCTGWLISELPTHLPTETFINMSTGALNSSNCDQYLPTTATGGCVNGMCHYTLKYYDLFEWIREPIGFGSTTAGQCRDPSNLFKKGTVVDLKSMGMPDGLVNYRVYHKQPPIILGKERGSYTPIYCVAKITTLNLAFEQFELTRVPTVTDRWTNGCAHLEAQLQ